MNIYTEEDIVKIAFKHLECYGVYFHGDGIIIETTFGKEQYRIFRDCVKNFCGGENQQFYDIMNIGFSGGYVSFTLEQEARQFFAIFEPSEYETGYYAAFYGPDGKCWFENT